MMVTASVASPSTAEAVAAIKRTTVSEFKKRRRNSSNLERRTKVPDH
jgi:hypothetical protein